MMKTPKLLKPIGRELHKFWSPHKIETVDESRYLRERIVVVFALIFFVKLVIFSATNDLWPNTENLVPFMVYTLITAWIIAIPELFIKGRRATYLFVMDIILTLILLGDSYYIRFFGTLPVMSMLGTGGQLIADLPSWVSKLISYSDIILVLDIVFIWIHRRRRKRIDFPVIPASRLSKKARLAVALLPLVTILGIFYSDLATKLPFLYNQTSENKVVAKNIGVISTHLLDFSRNFAVAVTNLSPLDKEETITTLKEHVVKPKENKLTGSASGKRIIMIQVESLNDFNINKKVEGQEITPNINKLISGSNYFSDHYFTLGAGGTSDADFSANTSLYPLADSSVFVKYAKDNFTSLEKELKKVGYNTDAYHANSRGYWNRNTMYKSLGFDRFYASDNFKPGKTVNMGLSDNDFLSQSAGYIKASPQKSLSYLITLSSHFSFEMTKENQTLTLNRDRYTNLTYDYLQAIHYTDASLGNFFDKLKAEGLYDDSLIVLYGDHTAHYDAFTTDTARIDPESLGGKRVPLVIKLPGQTKGETIKKPSSHLDIMPTILNLVGAKATSPMFGRDLFGSAPTFFYTNTFENNYEQIYSGNIRYLNNNTFLSCSKYTDKKRTDLEISECNTLLNKRAVIDKAVSTLIKRNLFKDYLKELLR